MRSQFRLLQAIAMIGAVFFLAADARAIMIQVDYTYDTNNFFDTQAKRDAMQAAADRFSTIITSSLLGIGPAGNGVTQPDWRVGFTHPGTGASYELSTAPNLAADDIVNLAAAPAADEYGFAGLNADEWILFAGGRSLAVAGQGGTGTGTNFTSTFTDPNGPMHRGVISETPGSTTNTVNDLPAWGGSVAFDTGTTWHFGIGTAAPIGVADFYGIALHEIGHALGLNIGFNQWNQFDNAGVFEGPEAVAAFNADNGASETGLNQVSASNDHWEDGTYDSLIFANGNPNVAGSVGLGVPQDLLMEPIANFTPTVRRFELTNTDVAALRDVGWETIAIPEPSSILMASVGILVAAGAVTRSRRKKA